MVTEVLIVSPGFPANEDDSTCIPPLQTYLQALRRSKPELRIAVIATQYPYTLAPYQWHGIEVHPCNGRISSWRKPLAWIRARRAFDGILKRGPVKAIHSLWLGETSMLGKRFAEKCGGRQVLTLMGQDARDGRRWWDRLDTGPLTVALTPRHAATFQGMSDRPPDSIVPWGIDQGSLAPAAGMRDIDVLWCGSFIDVKQPSVFLDVLNGLSGRTGLKAVMIGKGGQAFKDRNQYMRSSLLDNATLTVHDESPRAEVLKFMARAKVLVHSSTYESQGYVFDEALLNGMSLVSHAVGSAEPSRRWNVTSASAHVLQAGVADMLDDPRPNDPVTLHPMEVTVNEYLRLYGLL